MVRKRQRGEAERNRQRGRDKEEIHRRETYKRWRDRDRRHR
jgi:hypothetical protein